MATVFSMATGIENWDFNNMVRNRFDFVFFVGWLVGYNELRHVVAWNVVKPIRFLGERESWKHRLNSVFTSIRWHTYIHLDEMVANLDLFLIELEGAAWREK